MIYNWTDSVSYREFADGEERMSLPRMDRPVVDLPFMKDTNLRHMLVVAGTHNNSATLDLTDLLFGIRDQGVNSVTLVIPYFGYARQDKRGTEGLDVKKAKARVELICGPLRHFKGDVSVLLVDPHVPGLEDWFPSEISCRTLSLSEIWIRNIQFHRPSHWKMNAYCIGSVDFGRTKEHEIVSRALGVPQLLLQKDRTADDVSIVGEYGHWKPGMGTVLILDDMISTGGSAVKAAQRYAEQAGGEVPAVYIVATHGIFCGDAVATLRSESIIKGVMTTDSHPQASISAAANPDFVTVIPIGGSTMVRLLTSEPLLGRSARL
jgi:ribose-phosphate pyrophosphokinase